MSDTRYYHEMRQLALLVRAKQSVEGAHLPIRQMWRIYREEGIERVDFREGLRHLRVIT